MPVMPCLFEMILPVAELRAWAAGSVILWNTQMTHSFYNSAESTSLIVGRASSAGCCFLYLMYSPMSCFPSIAKFFSVKLEMGRSFSFGGRTWCRRRAGVRVHMSS
ncbi:hypothetical protein BJ742DRAFT_794511 [Cladochytrium replicatum]|nr:hypothetical protein BJ742DRAFT_794511 [Cladochytrium replicatum]